MSTPIAEGFRTTRNAGQRAPANVSRPATSIDEIPWTRNPGGSTVPAWVQAYRYFAKKLRLQILFKSGAVCEYSGISTSQARGMFSVKSKGKWVWRNVYYSSYKLVVPGAKLMRRRRGQRGTTRSRR